MAPPNKRPAVVVKAEFEAMQREAKVNRWKVKCEGKPEQFQDRTDRPSALEAEVLCAGCPLKKLCAEAAVAYRGSKVWGGQVFANGKLVDHTMDLGWYEDEDYQMEEAA